MSLGLNRETPRLRDASRPASGSDEEPLEFPLGDAEPATDRVSAIWRAKWWLLGAAILAAVATVVVCKVVTPTYESSATVRISLPPNAQNFSSQGVSASSDLATQYAELVNLQPVLERAARRSGTTAAALQGSVSAGTVGGQNLIAVRAQASDAATAGTRANALAAALTATIESSNKRESDAYRAQIDQQLAPIDQRIGQVRREIDSAGANTDTTASQTELGSLLGQRQEIAQTLSENGTSQPTAEVFSKAGAGSQVEPRPLLYAVIAFVAVLLIGSQVAVLRQAVLARTR